MTLSAHTPSDDRERPEPPLTIESLERMVRELDAAKPQPRVRYCSLAYYEHAKRCCERGDFTSWR